jgi:HAD superfamily hydrolase (TIGR01450 family)
VATWAIDLDGVVWRGSELLPGADGAVSRLLSAGHAVVFCTNHALSPELKRRQLEALGVPAAPVITSAQAAAWSCPPDSTVLALGDPSLVGCLRDLGLRTIDVWELPDGEVPLVDVVVVGATARWDRSRVGMAADAVRAGAALVATNDDPTYPVAGAGGATGGGRLLPGNGALVAAVSVAAGVAATVAGKPHGPMVALLEERFGKVDIVIGDKAETDGAMAEALGARFGLVLSGVTSMADLPVRPEPWLVAADLAGLVDAALRSGTA